MLLSERMARTGRFLFRWRGQVLLVFFPWLVFASLQGEPVEVMLGEVGGDLYEGGALALVLLGLAIRIHAVGHAPAGTSGRNTGHQKANDLNTTGLYSLCRNPLYFGNCCTYIGIALFSQSLALAAFMALFLIIYYERIILAEESFLRERFGATYLNWASRVPAIVPRARGWVAPALSFSLRSVLRREYPTWLAAGVLVSGIEIFGALSGGETIAEERGYLVLLGLTLLVTLGLRFAKKHTLMLTIPGR